MLLVPAALSVCWNPDSITAEVRCKGLAETPGSIQRRRECRQRKSADSSSPAVESRVAAVLAEPMAEADRDRHLGFLASTSSQAAPAA